MSTGLISSAYIAASILFILSLGGLSGQETARRGNLFGILGMSLAVAVTVLLLSHFSFSLLLLVLHEGVVGTAPAGIFLHEILLGLSLLFWVLELLA